MEKRWPEMAMESYLKILAGESVSQEGGEGLWREGMGSEGGDMERRYLLTKAQHKKDGRFGKPQVLKEAALQEETGSLREKAGSQREHSCLGRHKSSACTRFTFLLK